MVIVKKNIYYIPNICDDAINFNYAKGSVKPMCVYLTDEGLKRIVPNVETYINGKPWYEVQQVSCKVSAKEFTYKSHCSYEREERLIYPESKGAILNWRSRQAVYRYLVKGWLVPISYKNVFYVDSNAKKDGNGYILTEKFQAHDTGFFGKSRADSIRCSENEMFFTYEECEKYIAYRQFRFGDYIGKRIEWHGLEKDMYKYFESVGGENLQTVSMSDFKALQEQVIRLTKEVKAIKETLNKAVLHTL